VQACRRPHASGTTCYRPRAPPAWAGSTAPTYRIRGPPTGSNADPRDNHDWTLQDTARALI
jgi:hypothetical protein